MRGGDGFADDSLHRHSALVPNGYRAVLIPSLQISQQSRVYTGGFPRPLPSGAVALARAN
jgi:hypothetical protein